MANVVQSQTLFDGSAYVVMKFVFRSDGVAGDESSVTKVDVSALSPAASLVSIEQIGYSVSGLVLTLEWDATTNVPFLILSGSGGFDFNDAPLENTKAAGYTGDIAFTTTGANATTDCYSVVLKMRKTPA